MYAPTYIRLDISSVVGRLDRYKSNPRLNHWKVAKKKFSDTWKESTIICSPINIWIYWGDWIFRLCRVCWYNHFWLLVHFCWRDNSIEESEAVCQFCIVCSMLCEYYSWLMAIKHHFRTWDCDSIAGPLKIYCNNSVVVLFSKTDKYRKGAKHMKKNYFVVK